MFRRAFSKRCRTTLGLSTAAGSQSTTTNAAQGVPSTVGLELLSTLPVRFSAPVDVPRFRVRQVRRHIEIRGNHALLLKRPSPSSESALNRSEIISIFDLPPTSSVRNLTPQSIFLSLSALTFTFQSIAEAQSFLAMLPRQSAPAPPSQLHPLRLDNLQLLGQGATAIVRRLSSDTAVKLIPKDRVYDSEHDLSQLIAERHAYSSMRSSPYILKLRSTWQTKTHFALVTDLAHYGDLHQVQLQLPERKFPAHIARQLFAELVIALDSIHAKGWLYRDMKPSNVLLTQDGHIRLADLGLMKRVTIDTPNTPSLSSLSSAMSTDDEDAEAEATDDELDLAVQSRLVAASSFVGTRRFMSPEVYGLPGRKRAYGQSADLWSLGVTLYVLLTGRFPFDGSDADRATLSFSVRNDNVDVSQLDSQVADLILKLLHKDPLERASLADVKRHPWLEGISWSSVRMDGILQNRPSPVAEFLRENSILDVDGRAAMRKTDVTGKNGAISRVSGEALLKGKAAETDWHLLGFEYMG